MERAETYDAARLAAGITLASLFGRSFAIFADRVAVTSETDRWTYRQLGEQSRRLAGALYARGIRKGDRVAVLSETRPEFVVTYCALASLGATALTLNIRLHPDEIAQCVELGRPTAAIASGTFSPLLEGLRALRSLRTWISFDRREGYEDYAALLGEEHPPIPDQDVSSGDIHNVLYTSGTTGRPKGAMISQGAAAIRAIRLAQWFELTPEDGFIGWLPLFHCGGDESLYATLLTGGIFAALPKADARTMFRLIERDRLTWTLLLPGVITDFLHHPNRSEYDLSSMRFAIGYANMMPGVVKELTEKCNIEFYDAFGQTEVSYLLAHGRSGPGENPSLRKTPSPLLEVRIVDQEMKELPVGSPGECVVRGPSVMSGYLDDPAATAETFAGGWLHTGDVLVRHDDGTLGYVDRIKYLVKTGGENVYPAEVEAVIARMAEVQEVCVLGVPHEKWGEAVKAVVVTRPGANLRAEDVINWCRSHLATYKRPQSVEFMRSEDLPRSTTGKLQRHVLAARLREREQR